MKSLVLILALIGCGADSLVAQKIDRSSRASRELENISENDIIFFVDYYYTAGEDIIYRRLLDPSTKHFKFWTGGRNDSAKVVMMYRAGIKIFNPSDIYATVPSGMDRPYAGWSFSQVGISRFMKENSGNSFVVETGIVGPSSGMGKVQRWVHKLTTFDPPKGWDTQIRDELVANLIYTHYHNWVVAEDVDFVSQSTLEAGTGMNRASQDLTLRLIHFNPINNSAITQTRLTWDGPDKKCKKEIYFFGGLGVDYVLTNIFIEGSLFGNHPSVFVTDATSWVIRKNIGLTYSNRKVSWSAVYNHLSKEVRTGGVHDYGTLRLAVRF